MYKTNFTVKDPIFKVISLLVIFCFVTTQISWSQDGLLIPAGPDNPDQRPAVPVDPDIPPVDEITVEETDTSEDFLSESPLSEADESTDLSFTSESSPDIFTEDKTDATLFSANSSTITLAGGETAVFENGELKQITAHDDGNEYVLFFENGALKEFSMNGARENYEEVDDFLRENPVITEILALKDEIESEKGNIGILENEIAELDQELERLEQQKKVLEAQAGESREKLKSLTQEIEEIERQIAAVEAEIGVLWDEYNSYTSAADNVKYWWHYYERTADYYRQRIENIDAELKDWDRLVSIEDDIRRFEVLINQERNNLNRLRREYWQCWYRNYCSRWWWGGWWSWWGGSSSSRSLWEIQREINESQDKIYKYENEKRQLENEQHQLQRKLGIIPWYGWWGGWWNGWRRSWYWGGWYGWYRPWYWGGWGWYGWRYNYRTTSARNHWKRKQLLSQKNSLSSQLKYYEGIANSYKNSYETNKKKAESAYTRIQALQKNKNKLTAGLNKKKNEKQNEENRLNDLNAELEDLSAEQTVLENNKAGKTNELIASRNRLDDLQTEHDRLYGDGVLIMRYYRLCRLSVIRDQFKQRFIDLRTQQIASLTFTSRYFTNQTNYLLSYLRNGIETQASVSLEEGTNTVSAGFTDEAGNFYSFSGDVVLDRTGPAIEFNSALLTNNSDYDLIYTIDGLTVHRYLTLLEGPQEFTVVATDRAGNVTRKTISVELDTIPPQIEVVSPLLTNEPNYVLAYLADGEAHSRVVSLEEGENGIVIDEIDEAGNRTTETITVTLDTVPPEVVLTSAELTDSAEYTLTYTVDGTEYSETLTLVEGINTISKSFEDLAGNKTEIDFPIELETTQPDVTLTLATDDGAEVDYKEGEVVAAKSSDGALFSELVLNEQILDSAVVNTLDGVVHTVSGGETTKSVDPEGRIFSYENGRVKTISLPDGSRFEDIVIDGDTIVSATVYLTDGRTALVQNGEIVEVRSGSATKKYFGGKLTEIVNPEGANATFAYNKDSDGNVASVVINRDGLAREYNIDGTLKQLILPNPEGEDAVIAYEGDSPARLITPEGKTYLYSFSSLSDGTDVIDLVLEGAQSQTFSETQVISLRFLKDGTVLEVIDSNGTTYFYTEGLIEKSISSDGKATNYSYTRDSEGKIIGTVLASDDKTVVYDENGNAVKAEIISGGEKAEVFYANGQVDYIILPSGERLDYSFETDGDGNAISVIEDTAKGTVYRYGGAELISFTDSTGKRTEYVYENGKVKEARIYQAEDLVHFYSYTYAGDQINVRDEDGIIRAYDADNNLLYVQFQNGERYRLKEENGLIVLETIELPKTSDEIINTKLIYSSEGKLEQVERLDGTVIYYADGKLQHAVDADGKMLIRYNYDSNGELVSVDLMGARDTLRQEIEDVHARIQDNCALNYQKIEEEEARVRQQIINEVNRVLTQLEAQEQAYRDQLNQIDATEVHGKRARKEKNRVMNQIRDMINAVHRQMDSVINQGSDALSDLERQAAEAMETVKDYALEDFQKLTDWGIENLEDIVVKEAVPVIFFYFRHILGRDPSKEEMQYWIDEARNDPTFKIREKLSANIAREIESSRQDELDAIAAEEARIKAEIEARRQASIAHYEATTFDEYHRRADEYHVEINDLNYPLDAITNAFSNVRDYRTGQRYSITISANFDTFNGEPSNYSSTTGGTFVFNYNPNVNGAFGHWTLPAVSSQINFEMFTSYRDWPSYYYGFPENATYEYYPPGEHPSFVDMIYGAFDPGSIPSGLSATIDYSGYIYGYLIILERMYILSRELTIMAEEEERIRRSIDDKAARELAILDANIREKRDLTNEKHDALLEKLTEEEPLILADIVAEKPYGGIYAPHYETIMGAAPTEEKLNAWLAEVENERAPPFQKILEEALLALPEYQEKIDRQSLIVSNVQNVLNSHLNGTETEKDAILAALGLENSAVFLTQEFIDLITEYLSTESPHFGSSAFSTLQRLLALSGVVVSLEDIAQDAILVDVFTGALSEAATEDALQISMFAMKKVAALYGVELLPQQLDATELSSRTEPFITIIDDNHFVLVTRVQDGVVYYFDSSSGASGEEKSLTLDEFEDCWTPYVLSADQPENPARILSDAAAQLIKGAGFFDFFGGFFYAALAVIAVVAIFTAPFLAPVAGFLTNIPLLGPVFSGLGSVMGGLFGATTATSLAANIAGIGISLVTEWGLNQLGVDPFISNIASSALSIGLTSGINGAFSGGLSSFASEFIQGAITGAVMEGVTFGLDELGLNHAFSNILGMGAGALVGGVIDISKGGITGQEMSDLVFKDIMPNMGSEFAYLGIQEAADALDLDPRLAQLAGIPIRSSVRGIVSGTPMEKIWGGIQDGLFRGATSVGLGYVMDEMDVDPLFGALSSAAITGAIEGALEDQGVFQGIYDTYYKGAKGLLTLGEYEGSPWDRAAYAANLVGFTDLIQQVGVANALETYATNIFKQETIDNIWKLGGIYDLLANAEQIEITKNELGQDVKRIYTNEEKTDFIDLSLNDDRLMGKKEGNILMHCEYVKGPDGEFKLKNGTVVITRDIGKKVVLTISDYNVTVVELLDLESETIGFIYREEGKDSIEFNPDGSLKSGRFAPANTDFSVSLHDNEVVEFVFGFSGNEGFGEKEIFSKYGLTAEDLKHAKIVYKRNDDLLALPGEGKYTVFMVMEDFETPSLYSLNSRGFNGWDLNPVEFPDADAFVNHALGLFSVPLNFEAATEYINVEMMDSFIGRLGIQIATEGVSFCLNQLTGSWLAGDSFKDLLATVGSQFSENILADMAQSNSAVDVELLTKDLLGMKEMATMFGLELSKSGTEINMQNTSLKFDPITNDDIYWGMPLDMVGNVLTGVLLGQLGAAGVVLSVANGMIRRQPLDATQIRYELKTEYKPADYAENEYNEMEIDFRVGQYVAPDESVDYGPIEARMRIYKVTKVDERVYGSPYQRELLYEKKVP